MEGGMEAMKQQDQWSYSKQVAAQIATVLQELNYKYRFQEELGVFQLNFDLRNSNLRSVAVFILVEKQMYTVQAICPLRIPQRKRNLAAEYICRINRRLHRGSFMLDFDTGELRSRSDMPFRGLMPWPEIVEQTVRLPIELFEQFGDGLLAVLYGNANPSDEIQKAIEGNKKE